MKTHKEQSRIQVIDWLLRMMKGMMIGSGGYPSGSQRWRTCGCFWLIRTIDCLSLGYHE